jgi:hypothetical protein
MDSYIASAYVADNRGGITQTFYGQYDVNKKVWNFSLVTPNTAGEYSIQITAYCGGGLDSACYKVTQYDSVSKGFPVSIKGNAVALSDSLINIITPNGGEKITNTGAVNFAWTTATGNAYFTEFYLVPSSDTPFTLTNPKEGVRAYSLGGGGSKYPNSVAYQNSSWSIGQVPDGKYKLRAYLYNYRDDLAYLFSEAIALDESDGYFTVKTSNANTYQ